MTARSCAGSPMAAAALRRLVNARRLRDENVFKIALYFPLGVLLIVLRLFLCLAVWLSPVLLSELPAIKSIILNAACFSLGIHVKKNGQRDHKTELLVANAVSIFDPLALHASVNSISPSKLDLPPPVAWILGTRYLQTQPNSEQFKKAIRKNFSNIPNTPLCIQPEECATSGKGVLKFNEWPFTLYDKVQPVAIEVTRLFGNVTVATSNHWSTDVAWSDVFWFLINPYTVFHINLLPIIEKDEKESIEEFANRTQKTIADFLKVEATNYTSNELRELVVSREMEQVSVNTGSSTNVRSHRNTSIGPGRSDLQRMAAQIKEILPTVPLSVITKDLTTTRSIDTTLTNILEGAVTYTPEENDSSMEISPGPSQPQRPPPLRTAASTFPRTAHDRQLSFQERKAQLVEAARRRYIEKHGLKNC